MGLIETYMAVLEKLESIAKLLPKNKINQERIDYEESVLLLQNELIIRQATRKEAVSWTEVLQKLELWKMDQIGVGCEAEAPGDRLVLSVIEDITTLKN